jgi:hypothetical protein
MSEELIEFSGGATVEQLQSALGDCDPGDQISVTLNHETLEAELGTTWLVFDDDYDVAGLIRVPIQRPVLTKVQAITEADRMTNQQLADELRVFSRNGPESYDDRARRTAILLETADRAERRWGPTPLDRELLRHEWFGMTGSDEEKLKTLFDRIEGAR